MKSEHRIELTASELRNAIIEYCYNHGKSIDGHAHMDVAACKADNFTEAQEKTLDATLKPTYYVATLTWD